MSETLLTTQIKREKGKLYFCGTSPDGFLTIGIVTKKKGKKE